MSSFENDIKALFAGLRSLAQESAYGATLNRVLDMQEQLADQSATRKLQARELREAEVNVERLEKEVRQQKDEIAAMSTALQDRESRLADMKVLLESEKKESQEAFRLVIAQLEEKNTRLEELESYTSKLRSTSSMNM